MVASCRRCGEPVTTKAAGDRAHFEAPLGGSAANRHEPPVVPDTPIDRISASRGAPDASVTRTTRGRWSTALPIVRAREVWHSWTTSRQLLALFVQVRSERPTDSARRQYEEVVVRWGGVDRATARSSLRRAEQSFIGWTEDRDLRLRDVALYVVVNAYLKAYPERGGVSSLTERIVARVIPENL